MKIRDWGEEECLPFRQSEQVREPADANFPAMHSAQSEINNPMVGFEKPASQR